MKKNNYYQTKNNYCFQIFLVFTRLFVLTKQISELKKNNQKLRKFLTLTYFLSFMN